MRELLAYLVAPVIYVTGFRFSKDYRWGTSRHHRITYRLINVIKANRLAGL
jgi:hypothetical protein